jgi:hypothetical protein
MGSETNMQNSMNYWINRWWMTESTGSIIFIKKFQFNFLNNFVLN